jgi:hypothetical protein
MKDIEMSIPKSDEVQVKTHKVVPVIDRPYPLSETAEALRYLGEGRARGKIVITMEHSSKTQDRLGADVALLRG